MGESSIEQRACSLAQARGWLAIKLSPHSSAGWPDRLFLRNGVAVFIEYKQPGYTPTKLQRHRMEQILNHGGRAFWVTSVKQTLDILEKYEK